MSWTKNPADRLLYVALADRGYPFSLHLVVLYVGKGARAHRVIEARQFGDC